MPKLGLQSLASVIVLTATSGTALAQAGIDGLGGSGVGISDIEISGSGWNLARYGDEIWLFLIDVLVTLLLTAAIIYHPVRKRLALTLASLRLPRLFFLYALIGMTVGFLVVQHGYIIGFVVFGIGALLRFRSNLDDPEDTVEMILVTVLGLCVGLDLPIMAIMIGIVGWVVILLTSRNTPCEVSLRAEEGSGLDESLSRVSEAISGNGWRIAATHRSHRKSTAEVLFLTSGRVTEHDVENILNEALAGSNVTWKVTF